VQPSRCGPGQLRPTLTGKQLLKPKQVNTFSLSLMNTGAATCLVDVTAANFELKIYSGRDRIWSSDDCSTSVKTIHQNLSTQKSVNWQLAWNGRRSRKDCQSRMEIPKAGTYFATAQLLGAKPVQLRMILRS
jgi:hypothetical protein